MFRSLPEAFQETSIESLLNSSSGSCHGRVVTWQEIGRTCGRVCSCPRFDSSLEETETSKVSNDQWCLI